MNKKIPFLIPIVLRSLVELNYKTGVNSLLKLYLDGAAKLRLAFVEVVFEAYSPLRDPHGAVQGTA